MYQVFMEKKVVINKYLEKMNEPGYSKLKSSILSLTSNPRPPGCKKLKEGKPIACDKVTTELFTKIQDKLLKIYIITIGHRRDVYDS
jgi:mRNA interferase RelE/StbE